MTNWNAFDRTSPRRLTADFTKSNRLARTKTSFHPMSSLALRTDTSQATKLLSQHLVRGATSQVHQMNLGPYFYSLNRYKRSPEDFQNEIAACDKDRCTLMKCTVGPLAKDDSILFKIRSRLVTETQINVRITHTGVRLYTERTSKSTTCAL